MPARHDSLALVELDDLMVELDQRNAELELHKQEARSWRAIAYALARTIRPGLGELDQVELDHTLTGR